MARARVVDESTTNESTTESTTEHAPDGDWPPRDISMSVFERVAAIVAEMPAIGKGQRNEQQGFMYRGHDDVMNALNPLLSKYGVFFVPSVLERISDQRPTRSGGVMYEVDLLVEYRFYGPQGDYFTASAWGEGTDSGDKSTNKAMTMALKNVLAQTFAVSTEEQSRLDTDAHTDEPTGGRMSARPTTSDGIVLRPGAPLGWQEIHRQMVGIDSTMPWGEWVAESLAVLTGETALSALSPDEKRDAGIRVGNGVAHLAETLGGREMPPPSREEIQAAFAHADAVGVVLGGPETPLDPTEAEHARLNAEAAEAAEAAEPAEAPESDPPVEPTPEQGEEAEGPENGSRHRSDTVTGEGTASADVEWPGEAP